MQQQINHVSHVLFVFKPENLRTAMDQFSKAFGIADWDGPTEIAQHSNPEMAKLFGRGLLIAQAVSEGIELLAPLSEGNVFADHIKEKGEGFFAMIYGVPDVRAAAEAARSNGVAVHEDEHGAPLVIDGLRMINGGPVHPSWADKLRRYEEVSLKPLCGLNFYLSQIEPRHGSIS